MIFIKDLIHMLRECWWEIKADILIKWNSTCLMCKCIWLLFIVIPYRLIRVKMSQKDK